MMPLSHLKINAENFENLSLRNCGKILVPAEDTESRKNGCLRYDLTISFREDANRASLSVKIFKIPFKKLPPEDFVLSFLSWCLKCKRKYSELWKVKNP